MTPAIAHLSQAHNNSTISQQIADAHDVLCKFKDSNGYILYLKNELGPDKWLYFPDEASPPNKITVPKDKDETATETFFAKGNKKAVKTSGKAGDKKHVQLTDSESNIIEALGTDTLVGEKIAKKAGYPYNSNFKSTLSGLRKRRIIGNKAPGYFVEPEYHFLLKS